MRKTLLLRITASLSLAGAFMVLPVPTMAAGDCVVIVNKSNPVDAMRAADLRKLMSGETAKWANGEKVAAVTPSPDSPEYGPAIKKLTGLGASDFKRYLMQLMFTGKTVTPARSLDTPAAAARFVSASPGGISCVPTSNAGSDVKTLNVQ